MHSCFQKCINILWLSGFDFYSFLELSDSEAKVTWKVTKVSTHLKNARPPDKRFFLFERSFFSFFYDTSRCSDAFDDVSTTRTVKWFWEERTWPLVRWFTQRETYCIFSHAWWGELWSREEEEYIIRNLSENYSRHRTSATRLRVPD